MPVSDKSLFMVMIAILSIMTLFETVKQLLFPEITIINSHIVTIIFSTLTGTMVAGHALKLHRKVVERHCGLH